MTELSLLFLLGPGPGPDQVDQQELRPADLVSSALTQPAAGPEGRLSRDLTGHEEG